MEAGASAGDNVSAEAVISVSLAADTPSVAAQTEPAAQVAPQEPPATTLVAEPSPAALAPAAAAPSREASTTASAGGAMMASPSASSSSLSTSPSSSPAKASIELARRHSEQSLARTHTLCPCRYLGTAPVDAPASAKEICRNIARLKATSLSSALDVLLCLPRLSGGRLIMMDAGTFTVIKSFSVRTVLFCASGHDADADSLGFTTHVKRSSDSPSLQRRPSAAVSAEHLAARPRVGSAGAAALAASSAPAGGSPTVAAVAQADSVRSVSPGMGGGTANQGALAVGPPAMDAFVTHLFVFASAEQRLEAVTAMAQAFGSHGTDNADPLLYSIETSVGLSELEPKGSDTFAPIHKGVFKLRANLRRRIVMTFNQITSQQMIIERNFQLAFTPGDTPDTQPIPLELISAEMIDPKTYSVVGQWEPTDEVPKDGVVTWQVSCDLVLAGLVDPVHFSREVKVRITKPGARLWFQGKRENTPLIVDLQLESGQNEEHQLFYRVAQRTTREPAAGDGYLERLNKMVRQVLLDDGTERADEDKPSSDAEDDFGDELTSSDEPIISGTGTVKRNMSISTIDEWSDVLGRWEATSRSRLLSLARKGIPDALRHQVWCRLAGSHDIDMSDSLQQLLKQESRNEQTIRWDLTRTFPAHDFFKDPNGLGQTALYKISKAYSIFDDEVGYCQGLSFIIAVLLLHMPEEEAFCLFVKIMTDFGVRNMFKSGFAMLQLMFYQLTRLMEDSLPDLHAHFASVGVEAHMFASQWFLTLFTAKFPLPTAYRIMDVFLVEGIDWLFSVALAFLKNARKDLLAMSFEEILQYFRVTLPRSYNSDALGAQLVRTAVGMKVNVKKLKKFEEDYFQAKAAEAHSQDPLVRLEEENQQLRAQNVRLEAESSMLAQELVNQKVDYQSKLDHAEEERRLLSNEVKQLQAAVQQKTTEHEEDLSQMRTEASMVKEMYRATLMEAETDKARFTQQIAELQESLNRATAAFQRERLELQHQARLSDAQRALSEKNVDKIELQQSVHQAELELAQAKLHVAELSGSVENLEQQNRALKSMLEEERRKRNPLAWFKK